MLQRIKSKKGFTLAELLIVVAIIAVLTAIAVPLFVTSLKKADDAALAANEVAVREAAVAAILTAESSDPIYTTTHDGDTLKTGPFYATAQVSSSGEVSDLKIWNNKESAEAVVSESKKNSAGGYDIKVEITQLQAAAGK